MWASVDMRAAFGEAGTGPASSDRSTRWRGDVCEGGAMLVTAGVGGWGGQVLGSGTEGPHGRAGHGLGVGHVGGVHGARGRGWQPDAGDDGGGAGRVGDGGDVVRRGRPVGRVCCEREDGGGGEHEREGVGLRGEQGRGSWEVDRGRHMRNSEAADALW